MTNSPAPEWPAEIYLLQVTDPVQGGPDGVANVATRQLDTRTQMLREGQQAQGAQITQLQTDLTNLTQVVAGSQAEVLAGVVRAQMSGAGVYSEQFAADWTLIDTGAGTAPLALTDAVVPVAGDDSLDVTSTAKLIVGETYVLFNGAGYRQEVTVAQILGPSRLRVTPALTGAVVFPAWLGRTDWDVSTPRQATAPVGGIYRTRPLDLGAAGPQPKAIIIRHSGPGSLDVEWQDADGGDCIDAPWWRRRTVDGQTETQYLLPTSGPTRLRITAIGGAVTVHWIATQPTPAMAEGAYNPAPRPRLISPTQGDQALGPQPVLQVAAYIAPPGLTVAGVVYEVAKVADNSVVHTSAPQPVNAAYTLPDAVVQQGTDYRFTAKIKAADGSLGEPSKPILGKTIPDFRVILPPMITAPATGATVQTGTALAISAFAVLRGTDTQTGVQMQVKRIGDDWSSAWDSGTVVAADPLVLQAPGALMGWTVQVRVRHWGAALGAGPWSGVATFKIDDEIWLTTPGDGVYTILEAGNYLVIPVGGGAAGGPATNNGGPGGGAGFRPNPAPTRQFSVGDQIPYRVGLGGLGAFVAQPVGLQTNDFIPGGQDSFFGDVVGLGASGHPWQSTPLSTVSNTYFVGGVGGAGSSNGGSRGANGAYVAGADGVPGSAAGYWSGIGLAPGIPGARGVFNSGGGHSGGAGGVKWREGESPVAGTGYADHPLRGRIFGGGGGEGYGAGGGGCPFIGIPDSPQTADNQVYPARSGSGAHGCIILRKVS